MNYRNEARGFLKRAEEELETKNDQRLKHAALELRMAMEAITYDRALAYKDEFPPSEYETWQPKKVMLVLLEIDPTADKNSSLAIGIEEEYGKPAPNMQALGSEKVLNMATLKEHYDALGSYLHMPTIKHICTGKSQNFDKVRARCEEITAFIREVLSSSVFNVTLGNFATMDCVECNKPIRKRIPHEKPKVLAECSSGNECSATYIILDKENGQVEWQPQQHEIECANNDCKRKIVVWQREIEIGRCWTCPECKGRNTFSLGVRFEPNSKNDN
jgi:hypothetical protein